MKTDGQQVLTGLTLPKINQFLQPRVKMYVSQVNTEREMSLEN